MYQMHVFRENEMGLNHIFKIPDFVGERCVRDFPYWITTGSVDFLLHLDGSREKVIECVIRRQNCICFDLTASENDFEYASVDQKN